MTIRWRQLSVLVGTVMMTCAVAQDPDPKSAHGQESTETADKAKHRKPNRLIREKSPYLLQHAYNPVQWYPWGQEAFQKARRENKVIFLSLDWILHLLLVSRHGAGGFRE